MLCVDKRCHTALLLTGSDRMQCDSRLTRRFRSVYLDDPALWQTAYAQSHIQRQTSRAYHVDGLYLLVAKSDYRSLAVLLFDFCNRLRHKL